MAAESKRDVDMLAAAADDEVDPESAALQAKYESALELVETKPKDAVAQFKEILASPVETEEALKTKEHATLKMGETYATIGYVEATRGPPASQPKPKPSQ